MEQQARSDPLLLVVRPAKCGKEGGGEGWTRGWARKTRRNLANASRPQDKTSTLCRLHIGDEGLSVNEVAEIGAPREDGPLSPSFSLPPLFLSLCRLGESGKVASRVSLRFTRQSRGQSYHCRNCSVTRGNNSSLSVTLGRKRKKTGNRARACESRVEADERGKI